MKLFSTKKAKPASENQPQRSEPLPANRRLRRHKTGRTPSYTADERRRRKYFYAYRFFFKCEWPHAVRSLTFAEWIDCCRDYEHRCELCGKKSTHLCIMHMAWPGIAPEPRMESGSVYPACSKCKRKHLLQHGVSYNNAGR